MNLPTEIQQKIYYYYLQLYTNKRKRIHQELLQTDHYLHLSEDIIPFSIKYIFAERMPRLISLYD